MQFMNIFEYIMYSVYNYKNVKLEEFGFKPGPSVVKNVIPAPPIISNPVGYQF